MSLTADETPLAWPPTVDISELRTCTSCAIQVMAPNPGTLQILSRRQGTGHGDGVNIEEANDVGADYRGQRYSIDEAVLHVPGLHVFPGQDKPYPAEYHIHMKTFTAPIRALTVVFGVSHHNDSASSPGQDYFAAAAAQLNPATVSQNPTLATLFTPGINMIQYQGPDLRGRTASQPEVLDPSVKNERQFLLMLQPLRIRASDLERIPREGSLSTNPVDLPDVGVSPQKTVLRNRMIGYAVLATPGVPTGLKGPAQSDSSANPVELECRPLKVVAGKDYIIHDANSSSVKSGLGATNPSTASAVDQPQPPQPQPLDIMIHCITVIFCTMLVMQFFYTVPFRFCFQPESPEFRGTLWIGVFLSLPIMVGIMVLSYGAQST